MAERLDADDGTESRTGRRPAQGRQPLSPRRLGKPFPVRLRQAILSDRGAPHPPGGVGSRTPARRCAQESRFLHAPVHRRAVALEFRPDQSGSRARNDEVGRQEPAARAEQPARRHRTRRRTAADQHDRRQGIHDGQEHRHHAGQGRVPERTDAADPVSAEHAASVQAAAADHSAVDQQVLHPRPARVELLHQMGGGPGAHGVRDFLGQPGQGIRGQDLRGLPVPRARTMRWTRSSRPPARSR